MKKSILFMMLLAVALVLTVACSREENVTTGAEQTATFAPPEPQPGELGTDAMTQTVELEDGRSVNEGGHITTPEPGVRVSGSPGPPAKTTTTTTRTTTTTTTTAPPPRRP